MSSISVHLLDHSLLSDISASDTTLICSWVYWHCRDQSQLCLRCFNGTLGWKCIFLKTWRHKPEIINTLNYFFYYLDPGNKVVVGAGAQPWVKAGQWPVYLTPDASLLVVGQRSSWTHAPLLYPPAICLSFKLLFRWQTLLAELFGASSQARGRDARGKTSVCSIYLWASHTPVTHGLYRQWDESKVCFFLALCSLSALWVWCLRFYLLHNV